MGDRFKYCLDIDALIVVGTDQLNRIDILAAQVGRDGVRTVSEVRVRSEDTDPVPECGPESSFERYILLLAEHCRNKCGLVCLLEKIAHLIWCEFAILPDLAPDRWLVVLNPLNCLEKIHVTSAQTKKAGHESFLRRPALPAH